MSNKTFEFYKEHPKTCSPDDFWGQVKRTVNGVPVSQEQIDMITVAVKQGLELTGDDFLLDLCCGNGALSCLLFECCKGGVGVDFSEYLIQIANENFAKPPEQTYLLQDAVAFCERPESPDRFTKMLCYGAFPYFEQERAELMLELLKEKFPNIDTMFIGNCPDKALADRFYVDRTRDPGSESDPNSAIGIWRTEGEFSELAARSGWNVTFKRMPKKYYAAHYRYDVLLTR